jgi:hypothetical protein
MSIFGMIVVDSWLLYKGCTGEKHMTQHTYYKALIDALIDNNYNKRVESRSRVSSSALGRVSILPQRNARPARRLLMEDS